MAADPAPARRHANAVGDGFGRLVALTIIGAAVPGAGLVMAGRRALGWSVTALTALTALAATAVVVLVVTGRAAPLALRWGTDPRVLLAAAAAVVVVALTWCLVILASHRALRRNPLNGVQRALSVVLVTALVGLVALPSATAARYAVTGSSALRQVFDDVGADRTGLAEPDVAAADPWADEPRITVLLLGADTGEGREGTRPDTIIVASIDTATGDAVLFNLPRQLEGAPFDAGSQASYAWPEACAANGEGGCMLNAAWLFGEQHPELYPGASSPGAAATREAAGSVLGLPIDYEAVIDLEGFEDLVDAMGGIIVDVPRDVPIGGGTDLATGGTYPVTGTIEQGPAQRLDGYRALWFARSRHGSDNDDRMDRQRCLLSAAVDQFDPAQLARAFPALAAAAERNVETDITARQLPAFVELGRRVQGASLRSLSLTSPTIDTAEPDLIALRALVQEALLPPPAPVAATPSASTTTATPAPVPPVAPTTPPGQATPPGRAVDTADVC